MIIMYSNIMRSINNYQTNIIPSSKQIQSLINNKSSFICDLIMQKGIIL